MKNCPENRSAAPIRLAKWGTDRDTGKRGEGQGGRSGVKVRRSASRLCDRRKGRGTTSVSAGGRAHPFRFNTWASRLRYHDVGQKTRRREKKGRARDAETCGSV